MKLSEPKYPASGAYRSRSETTVAVPFAGVPRTATVSPLTIPTQSGSTVTAVWYAVFAVTPEQTSGGLRIRRVPLPVRARKPGAAAADAVIG